MTFPVPSPALRVQPGPAPVLLVAPHAVAPLEAAQPFVDADPALQAELAARIAEWHDEGSAEALAAASARIGATAARPSLPRGLIDLNRGWKGRAEAKETLFGKGALDAWAATHLRDGAREALEGWYRAAIAELAAASTDVAGFVEVHSYGDLGSTYDKMAGGRPVRRSEAAVVNAVPWASAYPLGLARLLPGDLRGTPWGLERRLGDALADRGLRVGPNPYPTQGPWAVSTRFLAARWFRWLGRNGVIPEATAARLSHLAWHDEQAAEVDAVAGGGAEPELLRGVGELAKLMGAWSHDGPALGDRFLAEDRSFTLVVELRVDRIERAADFGEAVGAALSDWLQTTGAGNRG
jgi:hypothetical protein